MLPPSFNRRIPYALAVDKLQRLGLDIIAKVKQAARANIGALEHNVGQQQFSATINPPLSRKQNGKVDLIAIGASTGGTEATKEVLCSLPEQMPPIVVVQHMPAGFTASYAQRLDKLLKFTVTEITQSGQPLKANHVYIAHGDNHLVVRQHGGVLKAYIDEGEPVNRHKPSVDVLFDSVAVSSGKRAVGVLLTGMGIDGARGMGAMRSAGAMTIAQDEESSVVWGMPRVAVQEGAAIEVLPLSKIAGFLVMRCY